MAGFAAHAKLTIVCVVLAVAADAVVAHGRRILALRRGLAVATLASYLEVPAIQPVLGALVVVEIPDQPGPCVVAALALFAEFELVLVFLLVTREAVARRIFEPAGLMALVAFDRHVFPSQREAGLGVVKARGFPGAVAVAGLALLALLAFVLVVLFVTAVAIQRCLAKALQVFVAGIALEHAFRVRVAQLELGVVVVEAPFGSLPVLLRMTVAALLPKVASCLSSFLWQA